MHNTAAPASVCRQRRRTLSAIWLAFGAALAAGAIGGREVVMLDELAEVEEAAGEEGPTADIAVEVAVAGVTGVESPTGIEGRTTGAEG